jgi:hypothetical protein
VKIALALLVAVAAGSLAGAGTPAAKARAQVWVAPNGNDSSCKRLTPSRPCASLDRAYRVARSGDYVEVAAGTYPAQTIEVDSSKTSKLDVTFRPAPGARPVFNCDEDASDCLAVEGAHVTIASMRTANMSPIGGLPRQGGVCICRGSDDVTFRSLDAGYVYIAGDNARVLGGDYGPIVDQVSKIESNTNGSPKNILIDGAFFHDHRGVRRHPECWAIYDGENVTIRRSRFDNCQTFGMFIAPGDDVARNFLIENNFFSNTGDVSMSAHIKTRSSGECHNLLFRFNTFVDDDVISECPGSGTVWESNIFEEGGCPKVGTSDYNVVLGRGKCGPHDVAVRSLGLVDAKKRNLHLLAGSPARGRGNPKSRPARDIDGELRPRPRGGRPDAGADERR